MKTQEVELRAIINNIPLDEFITKLQSLGFIEGKTISIHDIYYCDNSCEKVEDAEMNKVGSFSVRVRKEINDGNEEITFNKKIITIENDHHAWEEIEEEREDFEAAKQEMLDKGYKFFFEVDKKRTKFNKDDFEVCIEDIKDFGLGVEVEIMTVKGDEEKAKKKIRELLLNLGVEEKDIVPKSITNIIMHQRAFK